MKLQSKLKQLTLALACAGLAHVAAAHDHGHTAGIRSEPSKKAKAPFDIFHTRITTEGNIGSAGSP